MSLSYVKPEKILLRSHPELTEKWLQDRIAEDPSLLGLGDLVLKDKERIHPKAGRLDLLLQEMDTNRRYEVEIQLGHTDESHVIRTIEYWDIERKRYPQYEHTAVIVAENITSRFLNVISLFNGVIPLVALQLNAVTIGGQVALIFTKVLDELQLGLVDEDEDVHEVTDRGYWEKIGTKTTLSITDELFGFLKSLDPKLDLKYNKFYIGLARNGQPSNFVLFRPKKEWVRVEISLDRSDELNERLEQAGVDVMDYDARWGKYRLRIGKEDMKKHQSLIHEIMKTAYDETST
jgi:hypothetical protein